MLEIRRNVYAADRINPLMNSTNDRNDKLLIITCLRIMCFLTYALRKGSPHKLNDAIQKITLLPGPTNPLIKVIL